MWAQTTRQPDPENMQQIQQVQTPAASVCRHMGSPCVTTLWSFEFTQYMHKNNLICNYFILLNHRILGHYRKQPAHWENYCAESTDLVIPFAFHVLAYVLKICQQLS